MITSSARTARWLTRAYAEDARAQGLRSWQSPTIRDWNCWLEDLYCALPVTGDAPDLPSLLSPLDEQLLWAEIQADEAAAVMSPQALARLAGSGYGLLSAYHAHSSRRAPWAAAHEDAEHFLRWAAAFDARCRELQVLPRAELEAELRRHAAALALPPSLFLVGFDRLTPAQQLLLDELARHGVTIARAALDEAPSAPQMLCAAEEREELASCAQWVRAQLETNPHGRFAVLLPEVSGIRAQIDRVFRRTLMPTSARRLSGGARPYEFSLGIPLGAIPLVSAALLLLRWLTRPLAAAEVTSLLTGDFLAGSPDEAIALATADRQLRAAGLLTTELGLAALLSTRGKAASRRSGFLPEALFARLQSAEQWGRREGTRNRTWAEWAAAAEAQLETLAWPGFRELDSESFQARERWRRLLDEVAGLGAASRATLSWSAFVAQLTAFAHNTLFAAESLYAPVQILGIAEAAGQTFDAVWLLGMSEDRWPGRARMHPLLAPALQRDHGMPHAVESADLQLAEQQLRRSLASAPLVVCSYARSIKGVEARPSPLLPRLAASAPPRAPLPPPTAEYALVRESEQPDAAPWPLERIAGGSEILKRQAACGFQSFAVKRLGAEPLEAESRGLDARERATLLHRALEQLWSTTPVTAESSRLHTSGDLEQAWHGGRLASIVDQAIARSFASLLREAVADIWHSSYFALEQQRLRQRLLAWLQVELDRPAFQVVRLEQRLDDVRIGDDGGALRLNLRADRVDEIAGSEGLPARKLILDYKTAEDVHTGAWEGERPDEPQLPIYALYGGLTDVAGVAFAQIRAGKTRLVGVAERPREQLGGSSPKSRSVEKPDSRLLDRDMLAAWDAALRSLAAQFAAGAAAVDPKHGEQTCSLCGLYGVCRIRSLPGSSQLLAGDDGVEEQDWSNRGRP